MLFSSQNPYVEFLMTDVMVLEGEAYGMCLGHEDGALMNAISVLIKDALLPLSSEEPERRDRW